MMKRKGSVTGTGTAKEPGTGRETETETEIEKGPATRTEIEKGTTTGRGGCAWLLCGMSNGRCCL